VLNTVDTLIASSFWSEAFTAMTWYHLGTVCELYDTAVFSLPTVTLLAKMQQTILVLLGHPRLMKSHR
jgi:hypothetical protein